MLGLFWNHYCPWLNEYAKVVTMGRIGNIHLPYSLKVIGHVVNVTISHILKSLSLLPVQDSPQLV
jgi:hypothetical protein